MLKSFPLGLLAMLNPGLSIPRCWQMGTVEGLVPDADDAEFLRTFVQPSQATYSVYLVSCVLAAFAPSHDISTADLHRARSLLPIPSPSST